MKVGVQLPEVEWVPRWADIREMALAAEEIGLDSIWVGDHLLYRYPDDAGTETQPARGPWEAWTQLAAVAAVTERIELGPLVAATSFHNPAMIAKKAATLDEISGGRLILGLGAGWNETEYRAYGFPFDHRVSRFEEAFTIIRVLLKDGRIDFAGDYYRLTDAELVPRGPRAGGTAADGGLHGGADAVHHPPPRAVVERVVHLVRKLARGISGAARPDRRRLPEGRPRSGHIGADARRAGIASGRGGATPGQP